jgi:hypothetical protein
MSPLLKKLNYKNQQQVVLLNLPKEQEHLIQDFGEYAKVLLDAEQASEIEFVLIFCTKKAEVDAYTQQVTPKLIEDGGLWFAYPKGTSKRYKCDFNRDNGWNVLGEMGFEGVRMVAVDEDWSALRFRKAKHIKTMTRSFAMSKEGKAKVKNSKK